MDLTSLIGGIIGGALGGSAFAKFVIDAAKERWMERVKAQSATELERLKDSMLSTQKSLQARLDEGVHVTQAQYDLELASYKELWTAMSELRERWRSLFVPYSFQVPGQENPWIAQALDEASKAVFAAHDAAVMVTGRLAPFYEKNIQTAARTITSESHMFLLKLNEWNHLPTSQPPNPTLRSAPPVPPPPPPVPSAVPASTNHFDPLSPGAPNPTPEEIGARLQSIIVGIEAIDNLIRNRLTSLRLL